MFSLFRSPFSRVDRVQEGKAKDSERRDDEEERYENILSLPRWFTIRGAGRDNERKWVDRPG